MVGSISIPVCLWCRLICGKYGGRKCENIYQTSLQWIFTHLPMRAWICWLWYCQHQSQGRNSNKCCFSFDVSSALAQLLFDLSSKQVFSCVWFPLWGLFRSASSQTPLLMFWIRHSKCRVCESGLASPLDDFVVCQPRSTILITRLVLHNPEFPSLSPQPAFPPDLRDFYAHWSSVVLDYVLIHRSKTAWFTSHLPASTSAFMKIPLALLPMSSWPSVTVFPSAFTSCYMLNYISHRYSFILPFRHIFVKTWNIVSLTP